MDIAVLGGLALLIGLYEFGADPPAVPFSASPSRESLAPGDATALAGLETVAAAPIAGIAGTSTPSARPLFSVQPSTVEGRSSRADLEAEYDRLNDNPEYPSLQVRLNEMTSRREGRPYSAREVLDALRSPHAWTPGDADSSAALLASVDRHDGRVFVHLDRTRIETLMSGDQLILPLEQENREYTLHIDDVEVGDHNEVTWRGHLTEFPADNQVTITQGGRLTLAGITTPAGHYVLEARQGEGWIAASGDLFRQDFSQSDEIVPYPAPGP